MTNVDFHLQLNHNDTWSMSRLHFHDYCELLLPLTSPGNIFVNDQVSKCNVCTFGSKLQSDSLANTTGGTGYNGCFSV